MPASKPSASAVARAFPLGDRIGRLLERVPRPALLAAGYALVVVVAFFDDRTTPAHLTLLIYYLAPIILVAWGVGPLHGLVIAAVCGLVNLAIDLRYLADFPSVVEPIVNDLVGAGVYLLAARTVSMLRHLLEAEQALARTDPGTGAANRRAFFERTDYELERARRSTQPVSAISLDVDNFKAVNDRLGHAAGDEILKTVAAILLQHTRAIDLVARLGGDEFAVLLPGADQAAARAVVERLQPALEAALAGSSVPVSVSEGVVTFLSAPATTSELLQQADELLYAAKNAGKNRQVWRQIG